MSNFDGSNTSSATTNQPAVPGTSVPPAAPIPLSADEERLWAALAHLSSLLSLATGGLLGAPGAFVVWLIYRDRSRFVAGQAMQSTLFQVAGFILNITVWGLAGGLMTIGVGFCLLPFALLITTATIVWPLVAAYDVSQGRDFRYPVIADMVYGPRP